MVLFTYPSFTLSFVVADSLDTTTKVTETSIGVVPGDSSYKKLYIFEKVVSIFHKKHAGALTSKEIRKANSNSTTGFVFSLVGLLVLLFFAIPGLIISKKL